MIAAASRRLRGAHSGVRLLVGASVVLSGIVFSGCAPDPGSSASPGPSATSSSAAPSPVASNSPAAPSEGAPTDAPSTPATPTQGEILIVTAEEIAGALEVTAMLPGLSESGGECTLTAADGGPSSVIEATAGNGVTYCGVMRVRPSGDASTWTFTVSYASAATTALSEPTTLGQFR